MSKKYLILGASAAGISAAFWIRRLEPSAQIACLLGYSNFAYNTCLLFPYLSDTISSEALSICSPDQAKSKNIDIVDETAQSIDHEKKMVLTTRGNHYAYDALLIATGTRPRIPSIPGLDLSRVVTAHSFKDIEYIKRQCQAHRVKSVIIIGAGLTGLECADALVKNGIGVTVIEKSTHILSSLISHTVAKILQDKISSSVQCLLKSIMHRIEYAKDAVHVFVNDAVMSADMLIFAAGVQANTEFLPSPIVLDGQGSIFVNDQLQTSVPNIYAAGDVAAHVSSDGICRKTTTWAAAIEQGIIAAHIMTGAEKRYQYKPAVIATEICGIGLRICGQFQEEIEIISYQTITLFVAYDNRHRAQAVLVMSERAAVGRQFPSPHVLIGKIKNEIIESAQEFC